MRGVATIGNERAAGPGMREVQEHGEGTSPLRSTGAGKGASALCGSFNQVRSPLVMTTEEPPADVDEGFLDGDPFLL